MGRTAVSRLSTRRGTGARSPVVRGAGGVLLRQGSAGSLEVACVHRPGRDDWTLPKGKVEPGESFEDCARREVLEETGYRCLLGAFAGSTEYVDRRGRPKVVAYWHMDPAPGHSFHASPLALVDEIDEVRWLALDTSLGALTYPHDRELMGQLHTEAALYA